MGDIGSVVPAPEPHSSDCPRFYPNLNGVEPPRVKRVGPPGSRKVGQAIYNEEETPVRITRRWREWSPPISYTTQPLIPIESAQSH